MIDRLKIRETLCIYIFYYNIICIGQKYIIYIIFVSIRFASVPKPAFDRYCQYKCAQYAYVPSDIQK